MIAFTYKEDRDVPYDELMALYRANEWSSAEKGETLQAALRGSHSVVTAWRDEQLVGLGNAISDGCLVVYYPHLLILPEFHGQGIGAEIVRRLKQRYESFHMQVIIADAKTIPFYNKCGFRRAGKTEPMWIYAGNDHS